MVLQGAMAALSISSMTRPLLTKHINCHYFEFLIYRSFKRKWMLSRNHLTMIFVPTQKVSLVRKVIVTPTVLVHLKGPLSRQKAALKFPLYPVNAHLKLLLRRARITMKLAPPPLGAQAGLLHPRPTNAVDHLSMTRQTTFVLMRCTTKVQIRPIARVHLLTQKFSPQKAPEAAQVLV